ncbi:TPA: hypothetical protein ACH3X2_011770 [Trebouxia sp. C0005]
MQAMSANKFEGTTSKYHAAYASLFLAERKLQQGLNLQAWDHLQMTVKLANLANWPSLRTLQSFAFQGDYAAFSNHFRLVRCHKGLEPQAPYQSIAIASEQSRSHAAAASRF